MQLFCVLVGTCQGSIAAIANGRYDNLEGDPRTAAAPNVGTVLEVVCDPGYEQTRGLPFYACQIGGQLNGGWNGDLFGADSPVCSRKCSATQHSSFRVESL